MKQAFTLIELLVVVAIIGILASASIVALGTLSSRSRDSSRRQSLSAYATSLEQYKTSTGTYYVLNSSGNDPGYQNGIKGWGRLTRKDIPHYPSQSIAEALQAKGYLTAIQTDPTLRNLPSNYDVDQYDGVAPIQPNAFSNDFFLYPCDYKGVGYLPDQSKDGVEFALYANLENPPTSGPNMPGVTGGQCGVRLSQQSPPGYPEDGDALWANNPFNYVIGTNIYNN